MHAPIIYCADVIARLGGPSGPLVLVERLGSAKGIALPGGKQDSGELLSDTARRELSEETGLSLSIEGVLATSAKPGRDRRGDYVSTVFVGTAHGTPQNEPGKTRVLLLTQEDALARRNEFVFDHFDLLSRYLALEVQHEST